MTTFSDLVQAFGEDQRAAWERRRLESSIAYRAGRGFREMGRLAIGAPGAIRQTASDFWAGLSGR